MAIVCVYVCACVCHELFVSQGMQEKKFRLFCLFFYCSRRAKNRKDMDYFWQIYCQSCAGRQISSFYSIKWVFCILKLSMHLRFFFIFWVAIHRGHKIQFYRREREREKKWAIYKNHKNMNCSIGQTVYASWISCAINGARK